MVEDTPQPTETSWDLIDRSAAERDDTLCERLRADASTRVLVVSDDRARVRVDANGATLVFACAQEFEGLTLARDDQAWAFLGRSADGTPYLVAAATAADLAADAAAWEDHGEPDAEWTSLRVAGTSLSPGQAALLVQAVSLGRWLRDARFCPACGGTTVLRQAGGSRRCTQCQREHFPRMDPAVIVAVTNAPGDRLLLGRNAAWGTAPVYSTFAGFVEAGESLEVAAGRELLEEAGVVITGMQYRGSQAWPYPRSLMVGFRAVATAPETAHPDGEEIVDVRWFTRDEIGDALAGRGDVRLPGPLSIAHELISHWHAESA